ncbi:unnamed protein product [Lota lota]
MKGFSTVRIKKMLICPRIDQGEQRQGLLTPTKCRFKLDPGPGYTGGSGSAQQDPRCYCAQREPAGLAERVVRLVDSAHQRRAVNDDVIHDSAQWL